MLRFAGLLLLTLTLLPPVSAWAADSSITTPDAGKAIGTKTLNTGAGLVHRQELVICDDNSTLCVESATSAPGGSARGLVTRPAGTADVNCVTGCATATDQTAGPSALGALNAAVTVALAGRQGASFALASGSLEGTLVPEVSVDGTNYVAAVFADPSTGLTAGTLVVTNPNGQTNRLIVYPGAFKNARVRVSAYTSGTANGTVVATVTAPQVFVTGAEVGGGGLQSLTFKGSSAAGDEMAALFRCVSGCSGTGGTSAVDNTVWVYGTTNVTPAGFVFDATPTAPDDGKVGAARMNANRDVHVYPVKPDGTAAMTANGLEVSPTTVVSVQGYNREQALLNVTTATNLTLDVRGAGSIAFSIVVDTSCTCVVVFEATFDDSVWFRVPVVLQTDTATTTTSHGKIISSLTNVTTSNAYRGWFKGTGWKSVRVRTSSMSAGQVDFHLQASLASNGLHPTQIHCTETATFDTAAATTPVQLIAAVADELIYICSVEASSDGTTQLKLVDGTSSTCASSATISANHRLTAQTGWTNTAAPGGILYKATGLNRHVCVQTSGSVQVNGIVSYARF